MFLCCYDVMEDGVCLLSAAVSLFVDYMWLNVGKHALGTGASPAQHPPDRR